MSPPVRMAPLSRTRPVIDARIDSLIADAGQIARAWAAALVATRPLERIAELPLEVLGNDGPALCAGVLQAVQSDEALAEISGDGADAPTGSLSLLTGARDAAEAAADIEVLRGVLWERIEVALAGLPGRTLADAGDRLAAACAGAASAGLARADPRAAPEARDGRGPRPVEDAPVPAAADSPAATAIDPAAPAVIVDEAGEAPAPAPAGVRAAPPMSPAEPEGEEIIVRAVQAAEGPAAWIRAIGGQLERHLRDGLQFSVLLAELVPASGREDAPGDTPAIERVLASEIGAEPRGTGTPLLTSERPGRWWIVLPGADRHRAERVAERVANAVRALPAPDGSGVSVAIGSASCPQDGSDAAALAAHADVGLYAARSLLRRGPAGQAR